MTSTIAAVGARAGAFRKLRVQADEAIRIAVLEHNRLSLCASALWRRFKTGLQMLSCQAWAEAPGWANMNMCKLLDDTG